MEHSGLIFLVAFKYTRTIPKVLVLRKLTPNILNILNRLLLSYFLIYFDENLRIADLLNIVLYLHIFLPKLLITVFLKRPKILTII